MRRSGVFLLIGLAACGAQQPPTAFEHCGLDPNTDWLQIESPPERVEIVKIPLTDGRYRSVGEQLLTASIESEVWFKNAEGTLAACVYTPAALNACEGGVPRTIRFQASSDGWRIVERSEGFCLE